MQVIIIIACGVISDGKVGIMTTLAYFRRLIWLLIVMASITMFAVILIMQIVEYYRYRNTVDVEIYTVDNVVFPAVTICNHNRYR